MKRAAWPVRNPLPKISLFKEIYGAVTGNIAMNFIIGSALVDAAEGRHIHLTAEYAARVFAADYK